ncbi:MAG TPA: hypothetical protein PLB55_20340 [Prosthecobacter sp.]|nr:hypothetical protein [Prosthecobacter sp.]
MNPHPLLIALCISTVASAADFAAWTHRQTVRITQPGLTRFELESTLLDASRTTGGAPFHDLRVISPTGVETPYIIALPRTMRPTSVNAEGFKTTLNPTSTVLEFQPPDAFTVQELVLKTNGENFIKAATLEASNDGTTWQTLSSGEVLCRQNGTERLRLPIASAAWAHFRITIDDSRNRPIAFTGAQIVRELPELRTVPHSATIRSRTEEKGATRLTLDLGTANVMLGTVRIHTPELVFQRVSTLLNTTHTLFRIQHEGFTAEDLKIPAHQLAAKREVELVIHNGDSPPLRLDRVEVTRHMVPLVFQADAPGEWQLYIGNAQASEPRYDIAALSDKLRDANANSATASIVEANAAFRKTATAPEVGETGAAIDVSAWSFQRAIQFSEAGVIELELDPAVLARCENDLNDVRIVRDGHQVPFLAIKPGLERERVVPFVEVADPKNPSWSKWDITMPFPNFPGSTLLLDSPTPLFRRTLSVTEQIHNEQGRFERILGTTNWQRTPGQTPNTFHLPLYTAPRAETIRLTTDNGDNAPLQITSVRVVYPIVRLLFRVPDTKPLHLCYGNRRAARTHYDLQLVRREFETATKVAATLGEEEKLPGYEADPLTSGKGSPWLWAALALVVGALLWIVSKMLPKQQAE